MELRFPRFQISLDSGLALCSRKNRWEKDSPHPAYPRILLSHKSTEKGGAEIWGLFFLLIPKKKKKKPMEFCECWQGAKCHFQRDISSLSS